MNTINSSDAKSMRDAGDQRLNEAAAERQVIRDEFRRLGDIIRELQNEKAELQARADRCEARVKALTITSADEIVAGMRQWLLRDEIALANAIRHLVIQAVE